MLIGILSSCSGVNPSSNNTQVSTGISNETIENTVETWSILEDTIYETTAYRYTSNVPGKKYAIQIWKDDVKHIKVCAKCHHEGKCLKGIELDCNCDDFDKHDEKCDDKF